VDDRYGDMADIAMADTTKKIGRNDIIDLKDWLIRHD
jgi:hypothetical protein